MNRWADYNEEPWWPGREDVLEAAKEKEHEERSEIRRRRPRASISQHDANSYANLSSIRDLIRDSFQQVVSNPLQKQSEGRKRLVPFKEPEQSEPDNQIGPLATFTTKIQQSHSFEDPSSGSIRSYYTAQSSTATYSTARSRYLSQYSGENNGGIVNRQVFSSEWLAHLRDRGIILDPAEELDWSGRGQHVEYDATEEGDIPLKVEKVLGYSATALVQSVMCRRIRLARKTIKCSRRLRKTEAIAEVEHLQRVRHRHVVRVVGTYTFGNYLCILLYPAAEWNLEEFMDDSVHLASECRKHQQMARENVKAAERREASLIKFFGCLSNAMVLLTSRAVKHMDLKPKNLLVRGTMHPFDPYTIYITDFGISRSYQSAAESETDSPTAFTRKYAAPEVVMQETRGFKADIFSLGCIYMEIVATLLSMDRGDDEREALQSACSTDQGDSSYQANISAVVDWYGQTKAQDISKRWSKIHIHTFITSRFLGALPNMLQREPRKRPTAEEVYQSLEDRDGSVVFVGCLGCHSGPEPFEAARPLE